MTTWLEDASANRHIKTYVKDFLDLSGNFTVRNNEDYKWNSYGQLISGPYESDGAVWFGVGVGMDVSGLTIVVGANNQNGNNISNGGAVTVYRYDTTAEVWYQLGNLITGESNNDEFGWNVDINDAGTRIMATDPTPDFVNVYDYNSGTNTWDKQVSITSSDGIVLTSYAGRISGDGNTIVFSSYINNNSTGRQYIYRNTSGTTWTKIGEFTGSHSEAYLGLSPSLSYNGNRVTVSERNYDYDANGNTVANLGRAAIYDYSGSGTTWNQVGDWIYGDSNYTDDRFGASEDLSKDGSIVAFSAQGGYYVKVYQYDAAVTGSWKQLGSTINGGVYNFGTGVRLSDDGTTLLISDQEDDTAGTNNGALFIYKYNGYDWVQQGSTLYGAYLGAKLGYHLNPGVSISGDGTKIVAGGLVADVNGTDSGYVQAFQWSQELMDHPFMEISGNTMTVDCNNSKKDVNAYITNQLGNTLFGEAAGDHFGIVAEMNKDGSVVVIGAKGGVNSASDDGAVYVYTYRSGVWQQKGSTLSPYPGGQFGFGGDINDDGNVIIVGSQQDETENGASSNGAGSLDVFEFTNGDWVQKGSSIKGIVLNDHLGKFSSSINGAGNIIAGLFHMSGFVRVYQYDDDTSDWVQMGGDIPMTPGTTTVAEYCQTRRIDLSEDGTIIALGDVEDDTTGTNNGKITIYKYTVVNNVGSWNKLGDDIVSPNGPTDTTEAFGTAVSLSSDGHTVAFNSLEWNNYYGLARIFKYSEEGNVWTQFGADFNATTVANYGGGSLAFRGIALSGDGKTFIHGDSHNDGGVSNGGAVHMYKYLNGQWNHFHTEYGTISNGYFGLTGVGMSRDGTRFVASTGAADYPGTDQGYSRMFEITKEPTFKIENNRVQMKATTIRGHVGIGTAAAASTGSALTVLGANPSHNTTVYPINITTATNSFTEVQEGIGTGMSFSVGSVAPYVKPIHTSRISCYGGANIPGTTDVWKMGLETRDRDTIAEHITCIYTRVGINQTNPIYTFDVVGTIRAAGFATSSDDRLKVNEQKIEGALTTLQKLVPQTYTKYEKFDISGNKTTTDLSSNSVFEAGLIAQEIYYNAPELRHLVSAGDDASATNFHPQEYDLSGNDIQHDPDYTALGWGNDSVSVNYTQLIPYLIKAIQEQKELIDTQASQIDSLLTDITVLENE